jgi:hypothetical protein
MAKVTFGLSDHELRREERAVEFVVRTPNGKTKIGRLVVSKGRLRWYPTGTTARPHSCDWETFADKMKQLPRET